MGEGNFLSVSNEASTAPKSGLSRFLPGLRLFREYRREWFPSDLIAGLSVSFVVIPAAIAYATLMGLPPQYGLFAPLAPLLVYPFFGSSRQFIVGPDIAITLLVASAIIPLSAGDPTRAPALRRWWRCWRESSFCWAPPPVWAPWPICCPSQCWRAI
jgi:hypothetical protein